MYVQTIAPDGVVRKKDQAGIDSAGDLQALHSCSGTWIA
jgi:hypothetical protein